MPGRRPLLPLVALCALPLPACIHIGPSAVPITSPEQRAEMEKQAKAELEKPRKVEAAQPAAPRLEFGTLPKLPKVPGSVVATNPGAPATEPNTTAHKPAPVANAVRPAGGEPEPFPVLPVTPPEPPLLAAMRAYTEGRPEQAIEIIRKMDKPNQDFVLAVLPTLARGATADLTNDPATVAALVDQLRATATRLEPRAALKVEKALFCSAVDGFGRYVSRPEASPYKPNEQAQLYLELRNLGNQPTADGFLTHVHAAVEIRDANDKLVAQIDPDDHRRRVPVVKYEKRLVTRSPLSDFHVLYIFAAPPAPGVYTVTVQLSDAAGRRTVKSVPARFDVAGP